MSWLWWILLLVVLGGIGWYFWSKSQNEGPPAPPKPPTGGLSPVSGFTAVKDRIEDESPSETSIWFRKIF
jgi:drug/metabolite transporter (DMT)-like permease